MQTWYSSKKNLYCTGAIVLLVSLIFNLSYEKVPAYQDLKTIKGTVEGFRAHPSRHQTDTTIDINRHPIFGHGYSHIWQISVDGRLYNLEVGDFIEAKIQEDLTVRSDSYKAWELTVNGSTIRSYENTANANQFVLDLVRWIAIAFGAFCLLMGYLRKD